MTAFIWSKNHQNPICEINPMNVLRQVPSGMFSRNVSRTHFTHPGVRETVPETELFCIDPQTGTHHWYALRSAYRQPVRGEVRTFDSQCWREPAVNTTLVNTESEQRLLGDVTRQAVTDDVTAKRAVSDRRIIDATFQGYQAAGYHAGYHGKPPLGMVSKNLVSTSVSTDKPLSDTAWLRAWLR
ncbi:hypothetical protein QN391_00585 [Pseudomonas sp. CCI1.2]|uniref:hypothetical protein n=1 Tax=Pseudomonas sp. CCI1.2 TaxID=3048614 RepID=UPI002B23491A|nr:hypothetical protein [Pseudomonas sp. CCI1.2]MEB0119203.1 hypothetical protein [Pseudomonas sp. CCI1.2]